MKEKNCLLKKNKILKAEMIRALNSFPIFSRHGRENKNQYVTKNT